MHYPYFAVGCRRRNTMAIVVEEHSLTTSMPPAGQSDASHILIRRVKRYFALCTGLPALVL